MKLLVLFDKMKCAGLKHVVIIMFNKIRWYFSDPGPVVIQ